MNLKDIKKTIQSSIDVKRAILRDEKLLNAIQTAVNIIVIALKNDNKILFCGNGGSAADAQHLAAELSGRFYLDREPLFAEALHVNTSFLTAIANDYGYEEVYGRLLRAMGRANDILFALSTSGNSKNIINAITNAKKRKMLVIGMTGANGGKMNGGCDLLLKMPSIDTPRIQEAHIMVGHLICELVEKIIFE